MYSFIKMLITITFYSVWGRSPIEIRLEEFPRNSIFWVSCPKRLLNRQMGFISGTQFVMVLYRLAEIEFNQ